MIFRVKFRKITVFHFIFIKIHLMFHFLRFTVKFENIGFIFNYLRSIMKVIIFMLLFLYIIYQNASGNFPEAFIFRSIKLHCLQYF